MNKKSKTLEADIDENIEEINNVDIKIKRNKKLIPIRKQKHRNYTDLSLRPNELNISQTDSKN